MWDDFVNARVAQIEGLSIGYLFRPAFEHVIPGYKFVNWAFQSMAPLDFRLPTIFSVGCFLLTLLVLHRLLAELFRPSWVSLALTGFFGASLVQAGTALWWGSALVRLPAMLCGLAAILAHRRYRRTGSIAQLALSVLLLCLGLAFGEETIFYLVVLILLEFFLFRSPGLDWRSWLPYLIPVALLIVGWLSRGTSTGPKGSIADLATFLFTAWFRVFVPGLLGFYVNPGDVSGAELVAILVSNVIVIGVVTATIVRRPDAWRAWVFFVIVFLVSELPAPLLRAPALEPDFLAHGYRFHMVSLAGFTLALGAAFLRPRRDGPPPPLTPRARPAWQPALVVLALVLYVASSLTGWARFLDDWHGRRSRSYLAALKSSLAVAERSSPGTALIDSDVPDFVVHPNLGPFDRLSEIAALIDADVEFSTAAPNLMRVTHAGRLEPVAFVPTLGGKALDLANTGRLPMAGSEPMFEGTDVCVRAPTTNVLVGFSFPAPVEDGDWYVRLRYRSDRDGYASVAIDRGRGFVKAPEWGMRLHRGDAEGIARLGGAGVKAVIVSLPSRTRVCLDELVIGGVEPR